MDMSSELQLCTAAVFHSWGGDEDSHYSSNRGGMGPRVSLDVLEERKIWCPSWESNHRLPVHSLVTVPTEVYWLHIRLLVTVIRVSVDTTGSSIFTPGLRSWKIPHISSRKFPFKMVHFLGVRGSTVSSYTVHDCTTGGHTDLYSIYVLYMQCVYTFLYSIFTNF